MEKISTYDEMYVDQEAVQDDDESTQTNSKRPPTAGTDVRLCDGQYFVLFCTFIVN